MTTFSLKEAISGDVLVRKGDVVIDYGQEMSETVSDSLRWDVIEECNGFTFTMANGKWTVAKQVTWIKPDGTLTLIGQLMKNSDLELFNLRNGKKDDSFEEEFKQLLIKFGTARMMHLILPLIEKHNDEQPTDDSLSIQEFCKVVSLLVDQTWMD